MPGAKWPTTCYRCRAGEQPLGASAGTSAKRQRRFESKLLEVQQEQVRLSEESLRIISKRYREGLTTILELEQAELALSRSRMAWLQAIHDLRMALARLQLATGELVVSMEAETCAPPQDG